MTPTRPKVVAGLDVNETDDGLIIYDEETDRVHHLNQTAAVVFELCDGTRTENEIALAVADVFGLSTIPESETASCIVNLTRERLIA